MDLKLNTQDLINLLTSNNNISNEEADRFIEEFFNVIEEGLSKDELVKIKDFGNFKLTPIQERESIDVNTQEKIIIPSHRRVTFVPAQTLKTLVNKPFAHFETTPLNDGIYLNEIEEDTLSEENSEDDLFEEDDSIITDTTIDANSTVFTSTVTQSHKLENEEETKVQNENLIIESSVSDESNSDDASPDLERPIDPPTDIKSSKTKSKYPFIWWFIIIGVIMIFAVLFAFNLYKTNNNIIKQGIEESDIPKPIKEPNPIVEDTISQKLVTAIPVDSVRTVKMTAGKTLRIIALDEYGSREFWVYIYLKNKQAIKDPDVIPIGFELILPNKSEFDIDENNPEMVAKAKRLGDQEMKKLW